MKKRWHFIIVPMGLFILLFFTRLILPTQIDDVSSTIPCEKELLELADVYYVIPRFNNVSNNKAWCEEILSMNKELAIHGVTHEYKEFGTEKNEEYLQVGINDFEECFEFTPEKFKPPNLGWTSKNDWMKDKLKIQNKWNQLTHRVYHCNDTGIYKNWMAKIF
ncbi:hypothetical protein KAS08_00585 [Candidatus Pacearchaeota archaeon]|nr:hypothetical protein [Candidatus Pacearchaeota archaeon]